MSTANTSTSTRAALSVNLVHYRQVDWCVSASRSILASDIPIALTVVNNSRESEPELMEQLPNGVELVCPTDNLGYAGAANLALARWLARSDDDFVVIGAHDLHVDPGSLSTLIDTLRAHPTFGVIGPIITSKVSGGSSRQAARGSEEQLVRVDWLSGTCLLLSRACINDIGGFDRAYGSYSEDVDLCRRAAAAGWEVGLSRISTANGLGTGDAFAASRASINSVRCAKLHDGNLAGGHELLRLVYQLLAGLFNCVSPFRKAELRSLSRARVRAIVAALSSIGVMWTPADTQLDLQDALRVRSIRVPG